MDDTVRKVVQNASDGSAKQNGENEGNFLMFRYQKKRKKRKMKCTHIHTFTYAHIQ